MGFGKLLRYLSVVVLFSVLMFGMFFEPENDHRNAKKYPHHFLYVERDGPLFFSHRVISLFISAAFVSNVLFHNVGDKRCTYKSLQGSRAFSAENTIEAHLLARHFGADVFETDVRLTKDGELVIFHDETVDRVSNAVGLVRNFTLQQIQALDVGFKFTADNGATFPLRGMASVPTLEQFLQAFPDMPISIEIKDPDLEAAQKLFEILKKIQNTSSVHNLTRNILVSGRYCESVHHFRTLIKNDREEEKQQSGAALNIPTSTCESEGILMVVLGRFLGFYEFYYEYIADWKLLKDFGIDPRPRSEFPVILQLPALSGNHEIASPTFVSRVHRMDQNIMWWVINHNDFAQELLDFGSDGICTDRIDLLTKLRQRPRDPKHKLPDDFLATYYHPPPLSPQEIHTCVTLGCQILQLVGNPLIIQILFFLPFTFYFYIVIFCF